MYKWFMLFMSSGAHLLTPFYILSEHKNNRAMTRGRLWDESMNKALLLTGEPLLGLLWMQR